MSQSRVRVLIASVLAFTTLLSCQKSPLDVESSATAALKDYNLVFIVIDTLRADHLGFHGYTRDTSPFLDSMAENGVVFERAYSASSYTRESVSALLTGLLPSSGGAYGWGAGPDEKLPTLGKIFKAARYKTGFFTESPMIKGKKFTQGFDEIENYGLNNQAKHHAPKLSERALQFAENNAQRPFMMYVHYLDPHGEYFPPPEYAKRFVKQPGLPPVLIYGSPSIRQHCAELIESGFGPGEDRYEDWVAHYDAEILYVDDAVKMLIEGLDDLGVMDHTLVVITSDHGEEFLEHNYVEHAWTLYEESLRVPLLFYAPGAVPVQRIHRPAPSVSVLPTILGLVGLTYGPTEPDGVPLFHLTPEGLNVNGDRAPIIAENYIRERNSHVTVIQDEWKYIAWQVYLDPVDRPEALRLGTKRLEPLEGPWFPLNDGVIREELYDLANDPGETRNLKDQNPEELRHLKGILSKYRLECEKRKRGDRNPKELTRDERKDLESLGYL